MLVTTQIFFIWAVTVAFTHVVTTPIKQIGFVMIGLMFIVLALAEAGRK